MEDLKDYKAEAPEENSNEPFKYKGPINILKTEKVPGARVEVAEKEFIGEFATTNVGDKIVNIPLQVPEEAEKNGKRVVFKKWNVDSTMTNKGGKTPAKQLADWLNPKSTGLVLSDENSLKTIIDRLNSESFDINLWAISFGDKKVQMSKLVGNGKAGGNTSDKPITKW